MTSFDAWSEPVSCADPTSVDRWNEAWEQTLHFNGDPFVTLEQVNAEDSSFAMGSVLCAAYRMLGAQPLDAPEVRADLDRVRQRAQQPREMAHLAALERMAVGDFTLAGEQWEAAAADTKDLAAYRLAHDVWLHVGDATSRLRTAQAARNTWGPTSADVAGSGFIASQYSFALEEVGRLEEAEAVGWEALEADPLDLWALHALAHVYETAEAQAEALDLLRSRQATWSQQLNLSVHVWWHLALRLIAARQLDEAIAIHDRIAPDASTPFRLSDLASLLWRVELAGGEVGDRWELLADRYAIRPEVHTSAFIDLHQAFAFTRCPDHQGSEAFFDSVLDSHAGGTSENSRTFVEIVQPLVSAVRQTTSERAAAGDALEQLDPDLHRIGGSNAQRDIVALTTTACRQA